MHVITYPYYAPAGHSNHITNCLFQDSEKHDAATMVPEDIVPPLTNGSEETLTLEEYARKCIDSLTVDLHCDVVHDDEISEDWTGILNNEAGLVLEQQHSFPVQQDATSNSKERLLSLTEDNISVGGGEGDTGGRDVRMIEYVRRLEADLSRKESTLKIVEEEMIAMKFALEETNYCKANLEEELVVKSDVLNKADYNIHVLRPLLAQADQQRACLKDTLGEQTAQMMALRDQLDQSYAYQRTVEKEAAEKSGRLVVLEEEMRAQVRLID